MTFIIHDLNEKGGGVKLKNDKKIHCSVNNSISTLRAIVDFITNGKRSAAVQLK